MNATRQAQVYRTITCIVPAVREEVFAYLADAENRPAWATAFCEELKRDGAHSTVATSAGELFFRAEDMPEEMYEWMHRSLLIEMDGFAERFSAGRETQTANRTVLEAAPRSP